MRYLSPATRLSRRLVIRQIPIYQSLAESLIGRGRPSMLPPESLDRANPRRMLLVPIAPRQSIINPRPSPESSGSAEGTRRMESQGESCAALTCRKLFLTTVTKLISSL